MTKTRTTMLTTAVVVIVAIVSSVVVGASSSSSSSSGADRHQQQQQQQQYDRSTKSTRMHERRRRVAAAIAVGDFFPPSMAPPTITDAGAEEEEAGRRPGDVVRMSRREVRAVQARWSAQPAGNSSNDDDGNKEKDAMLRRVIRDMNDNNDNALDEAGRRERKLGWWNGGSRFGKHNADPYAIPTGLADAGGTYYGE
jgi:hypothetical protein